MTKYAVLALSVLALATSALAQPATGQPKPVGIVLAAGDITGCSKGKRNDDRTAAILRREIALAKAANIPVKILALGDLAYDNGSTASFSCFAEHWGSDEFFDDLLPVLGNHDVLTSSGSPYFEFFKRNKLVNTNGERSGYYALNFPDPVNGPWRLVALNAYTDHDSKSPQVKWLDEDLKQSKAACILAFAHPFILSSGLHGHNDKTKKKNGKSAASSPTVQLKAAVNLFKALYRHGTTLYVAGHDHHFEQFRRHDAVGDAAADGIRSFVVGTGGHQLYQEKYKTQAKGQEYYNDTSHGVLKIILNSESYEWQFLLVGDKPSPTLNPSRDVCNAARKVS